MHYEPVKNGMFFVIFTEMKETYFARESATIYFIRLRTLFTHHNSLSLRLGNVVTPEIKFKSCVLLSPQLLCMRMNEPKIRLNRLTTIFVDDFF